MVAFVSLSREFVEQSFMTRTAVPRRVVKTDSTYAFYISSWLPVFRMTSLKFPCSCAFTSAPISDLLSNRCTYAHSCVRKCEVRRMSARGAPRFICFR